MNVKLPKGMMSPTVIVIGSSPVSQKTNDTSSKRMDMLEKKLDQQYKIRMDGSGFERKLDLLSKSFNSRIDKMMSMSKSMMKSNHSKEIEKLRREFEFRMSRLQKQVSKKPNVQVSVSNAPMRNSLEKMTSRLEAAIMKARPRLTPSPS